MTTFHIIVGSVMGTAESVAKTLQQTLVQAGHTAILNTGYTQGDITKHNDAFNLICTSNTGMGDLPENISPLLAELTNAPPNLYDTPYAIINLGDSSYPDFAQAGFTLDDIFTDLGARRLGDVCVIDAIETTEPEDYAAKWLQDWLQTYSEEFKAC